MREPSPATPYRDLPAQWLVPAWPVSSRVRAFVTTRAGGVSTGPFASLNLGRGTAPDAGDDPLAVDENRRRVAAHLPAAPTWLRQVHGCAVARVERPLAAAPEADAAVTRAAGVPLVVLVADCLPVILAARDGTSVAIAHAGWRGLAAGVLEATVAAMDTDPASLRAWLGPCIGPRAFEVGDDVRDAFVQRDATWAAHFAPHRPGKWLADLPALARARLAVAGVSHVHGGQWCTVSEPDRFYSYRRDGVTGRFGAFVWLAGSMA